MTFQMGFEKGLCISSRAGGTGFTYTKGVRPRYIIGIDEAGRGPVAGPLAVGAVCAPADLLIEHIFFKNGIRDSKKLTLGKREELFSWIKHHHDVSHVVSMVGPRVVDREGISAATTTAIARALRRLVPHDATPSEVLVLLDGGLKAPRAFMHQATIIKGDECETLIALASVAAKVVRDAKMRALAVRYPCYGFEGHKGYGTKEHLKAIQKFGMCDSHRKSFLTRFA